MALTKAIVRENWIEWMNKNKRGRRAKRREWERAQEDIGKPLKMCIRWKSIAGIRMCRQIANTDPLSK